MIKKMMIAAVATAMMATPAFALNRSVNLGDIAPDTSRTAQIIHFARGNGTVQNGRQTEVYASAAKAFTDNVFFNISLPGDGAGVFTIQVLKVGQQFFKNITNGALTLVNLDTNETLFDNTALTSGANFAIPFTPGSYQASISGNASGRDGGDYQITFAAPVPEPAVVGSMGAGLALAGFVAVRRRRKAAKAA